jgi:hypothetical protein|tara:strand:- start:2441 stop:2704 length:264 start_codon:yes stop_codon:yes gene_type:complete
MRLTIHIENGEKTREERIVKRLNPKTNEVEKVKKEIDVTYNTLSFRNIPSKADAEALLGQCRDKYIIRKWSKGDKKGKEMFYIANEK